MSQVDLVYRLQQIDDEIRTGKKRLGEVIRLQTESKGLGKARERVAAVDERLLTWRVTQKDLSLELDGLNDKVKRDENRLYSGTVKNPKELSDLQMEIESLGRRRAILEDDVLEAMINFEEALEEEDAASIALEQIQAQWNQTQSNFKIEQAALLEQIQELTVQRKQLLTIVTSQSLRSYENAGRRAGITAVVSLRNGRCLGCQVTIPATQVKAADEGQLITCDSCSRILCP